MVWQRARSSEQKEQRRRALLAAAASLARQHPIEDVSLNAIAREANVSKANVYRYFESREELFLELTLEAVKAWCSTAERRLGEIKGSADTDALARALTSSVLETTDFAELCSALASVFERNVSTETIARFKSSFLQAVFPLLPAVIEVFPTWSLEDAERLVQLGYFQMVGMWPAAHPSPAVAEALKRPELSRACISFETDFRIAVKTLAAGIDADVQRRA